MGIYIESDSTQAEQKNINQVYLQKKELFSVQVIMAFGLVIYHSIVFQCYLV